MNVQWPCPDHLKLTPIAYNIQCCCAEYNITADDHTHSLGATCTDGRNEGASAGAGYDDTGYNVAGLDNDVENCLNVTICIEICLMDH
jgi:hypothetical protein